ncbi:hypothetical protein ACWDAZ_17225 [Streptomyces sp. NPDC001215]
MLYRLGNDTRHSDVILLLARTQPLPADQVAAWPLDHHPEAVATARPTPTTSSSVGEWMRKPPTPPN